MMLPIEEELARTMRHELGCRITMAMREAGLYPRNLADLSPDEAMDAMRIHGIFVKHVEASFAILHRLDQVARNREVIESMLAPVVITPGTAPPAPPPGAAAPDSTDPASP